MKSTIGLHEQYALVSPLDFKSAMNQHWNETLQMPSSPALRSLWEIMGRTFQRSIINTIIGGDTTWQVLQPPTGTGKTQGACVYAALQARENARTDGHKKPVGMMLVTRLTDQADVLAVDINTIAGGKVAVAYHSKNDVELAECGALPVLVITHQAYINALEGSKDGNASRLDRLVHWEGGSRLLTIIDEALANIIENNKVTLDSVACALGCVPLDVRKSCHDEVEALEALHRSLLGYATRNSGEGVSAYEMLWDESAQGHGLVPTVTSMEPLRKAMRRLPYDQMIGEANETQRSRIAGRVDRVLEDAEGIMQRWAYYAKIGSKHSFNSSDFLIPWGAPGPVVLDATASQNFLWTLLEDRASIVPVPDGARNYENVTLHVARASGVGKHAMRKNFATRYPRLLEALEAELGTGRSVFMCIHKDNRHVTEDFKTTFQHVVGHWGAVDGRNTWKDCDTAVIFGLPYRDPVWANNTFFAIQGVQDDKWLKEPRWAEHPDVRTVMQQRQMSVSVIQAINRIRCRKVTDEHGSSPPADIYIILPDDAVGEGILHDIKADMPRIKVVPWTFEMDGPKVKRPRDGSSHASLITFMQQRLPGETAMSAIQRELGLKQSAFGKLRTVLNDAKHATTVKLKEMGVDYVVRGRGRGSKSFLVKHHAA